MNQARTFSIVTVVLLALFVAWQGAILADATAQPFQQAANVNLTAPSADSPPLLADIQKISAGGRHTCALTNGGGIKCWGDNDSGQLGDGSSIDKLTPMNVTGLQSGVTAISAGSGHTCALTSAGGVKCWGFNDSGQLGDGTRISKLTPMNVTGLQSGVTAITAGGTHTCAMTSAGGVKCWGSNYRGQLGDGSSIDKPTPVDVSDLQSGVTAITAGYAYTCALTSAGGVKCWGGFPLKYSPTDVIGLQSGVTAITAGGTHTCAMTSAGGVKCWGNNLYGQLGNGSADTAPSPVTGLQSGVTAITAGSGYTCVLTSAGGVKCWGWNLYGQLGDGSTSDKFSPVDVTGLQSGVTAITAGYSHTCAITSAGGVKCWGNNGSGQLGDSTIITKLTPVDVIGLQSGITAITAGSGHTCALTSAGGVKCWGQNIVGELGDGTSISKLTPVDVRGLQSGVTAISAGNDHTCAMTSAGGVKCWGDNRQGQLGDGTSSIKFTPVDVSGLQSGVIAITAGGYHTCAMTSAGGVKCWGWNDSGQLGRGSGISSPFFPFYVIGLQSGVTAISASHGSVFAHTCALTSVGGVKCWGANLLGELGDGTSSNKSAPVDVIELQSGVTAISTGDTHTCALTSGGGVMCWGATGSRPSIVDVIAPSGSVPTPTSTPVPPTPTATPVGVYVGVSGMRIMRDTWGFSNPDGQVASRNAFVIAFGANAMSDRAKADKLYNWYKDTTKIGLCVGMSMGAVQFYNGTWNFQSVLPGYATVHDANYEHNVANHLEAWSLRQFSPDVMKLGANNVAEIWRAVRTFVDSKQKTDPLIIGMSGTTPTLTGVSCVAHVVTPFAYTIDPSEPKGIKVDVYDSNYPDITRSLYLNPDNDTWSFKLMNLAGVDFVAWGTGLSCVTGFVQQPTDLPDVIFYIPISNLSHEVAPPTHRPLSSGVGMSLQLPEGTYALDGSANLEPVIPTDFSSSHHGYPDSYRIIDTGVATVTLLYSDTLTGGAAWFGNHRIISVDTDVYTGTDGIELMSATGAITLTAGEDGKRSLDILGDGEAGEAYYTLTDLDMQKSGLVDLAPVVGTQSLRMRVDSSAPYVLTVSQPGPTGLSVVVQMPAMVSGDTYVLSPQYTEEKVVVEIDRDSDGTVDEHIELDSTLVNRLFLPLINR